MFRKHNSKRSPNILFVIFRLVVSLSMFAVLLGGVYSAYKHFSSFDPLKLNPQAVLKNVPFLSSFKLDFQKINPKIFGKSIQPNAQPTVGTNTNAKYIFRFLLLADSHNDNVNLRKAISQVRTNYSNISFIIGLGDYTDVGTAEELKNAKIELDSSGLRYFLIPGDHDLWDCRNRSLPPASCFDAVFGPAYQSFTFGTFRFLLLDNSDDYLGLGESQLKWITAELEKAKSDPVKGIFVFMTEPLFHPTSDHVMGKIDKDLKSQARNLMFQLKDAGVKKIFAGDVHYFSEYEEPETKLPMMTVGAITIERNPQAPRFAVVYVFEDGTAKVEDIEIK